MKTNTPKTNVPCAVKCSDGLMRVYGISLEHSAPCAPDSKPPEGWANMASCVGPNLIQFFRSTVTGHTFAG